jgi:hypothetical protein
MVAPPRQRQKTLQSALARAAAGEPVFPLWWTDDRGVCACKRSDCNAGKHPLTDRGFYDASTDPLTIKEWFERWPEANLGARTDHRPRIDIDLAEVAAELRQDAALPLQTRVTTTPRGGLHIVFASSGPTPSRVLFLSDGRRLGELKADLAYVVVSPSRIGLRSYVDVSPPGTPLLEADPVAWLGQVLPQFGFQLDLKRTAGGRDYEQLAGVIREGEGRHNAVVSYAAKIWVDGMVPETLAELLSVINQNQCEPPLPEDEVKAIVAHFVRSKTPGAFVAKPGADKPVIVVNHGQLHEVAQAAWDAILRQNTPERFFQHAGSIAEIRANDFGRPEIVHLTVAGVRGRLDRSASWRRRTEKGDVPVVPPREVVEDLMALDKPLPVIKGIVGTPAFAPDGALVTRTGFQPETQLFYAPSGEAVPPVPAEPDETDLLRARQLIGVEWLGDFPFLDDASRAHAIAVPVTALARELIDGPLPLFAYDAPSAGTGKGLLASTSACIVTGTPASMMSETRSEEELRKRITAILCTGAPLAIFDNVKRRLESGTLAALLTSLHWRDRILGRTENVDLPNRTIWMVTGNNLQLSDELIRRTVWIRQDSRLDRPWDRQAFRHPDLPVWLQRHRHEMVWAFLVLVQNWVVRGRPQWDGRLLGSFEAWCHVVGGILQAAGIQGFLVNRDELYRRLDRETEEWRGFISDWWEGHAERPVKSAALLHVAQEHLTSVFETARDGASERDLATRLGKALAERRDRRYGDIYLRQAGADGHSKGALWRLEPAEVDAEGAGTALQSSAHLPHGNGVFSDSNAEDAEDAEVVSTYAREKPPAGNLQTTTAKRHPQVPHLPPADSTEALRDAEDVRKNHVEPADVDVDERHLRGLLLVALERKRWPRLNVGGKTLAGDDAWRPWLRGATSDQMREVLTELRVEEPRHA